MAQIRGSEVEPGHNGEGEARRGGGMGIFEVDLFIDQSMMSKKAIHKLV